MMRSKRGGILLYILGIIALLSIVVTEFLMETAEAIRYRSQVTHREDLEVLAYSALETTIAVLAEIKAVDGGLYSPVQGWDNPLKYANFSVPKDYTVSVTIKDETGKLSIYQEDMGTFGNLLNEMDVSYELVTNLKSDLKEWLNKSEKSRSGEKAEKANAEPETKPKEVGKAEKKKQRQIYNFLELKELPVFEKIFFDKNKHPNEKFKLLKDSVSIIHKGVLNINTAPDIIKKLILGDLSLGHSNRQEDFYRKMSDLGIDGDSGKELEKVIGFKVRVLNIGIQVARGTVKYYLSALVGVEGESKGAKNKGDFTFLALTEDNVFDK